jgi:hypothetical protein
MLVVDEMLPRTPEIALRVLGVMVALAAAAVVPLVTMARKAAVFGLGGGKETGPPMRGVRPVRLMSGVRPVRAKEG